MKLKPLFESAWCFQGSPVQLLRSDSCALPPAELGRAAEESRAKARNKNMRKSKEENLPDSRSSSTAGDQPEICGSPQLMQWLGCNFFSHTPPLPSPGESCLARIRQIAKSTHSFFFFFPYFL